MLRSKLTYANVMATIAMFAALGGTGYAAVQLTGKNIKDGSLTTKDVKNRSLLKGDFKPGQLPAGERGPQGATGQDGAPGAPGKDGVDGQNGAPGTAAGYMRVRIQDFEAANPDRIVIDANNVVVENPPRSKGVLSVRRVFASGSGTYTFCFDLSFVPELGVGSAFLNNGAFVSTSVARDYGSVVTGCPADQPDAAARVYDTASATHGDVSFSIIWEQAAQ